LHDLSHFAFMSYQHTHQLRVRYAETDQMGFVYYGIYAQYYEVARVEAMRNLDIHYADIEREYGIWMPVMNMNVRFLRPARYDDLLSIVTTIPTLPDREIRFRYEIENEKGVLLNGALVQLCFLDAATQKRINAPDFIKNSLVSYF
jgi:acyl-CoA thioester hydrolase